MLPTVVIEATSLLPVSPWQFHYRGTICGSFTAVGCRFYYLESIPQFLKLISKHGVKTMRGTVESGFYVQESN